MRKAFFGIFFALLLLLCLFVCVKQTAAPQAPAASAESKPQAQTPSDEPKAEEPPDASKAEESADKPKAEAPADEPQTESPSEQPQSEEPADEPAEAPAADIPEEEPTEEPPGEERLLIVLDPGHQAAEDSDPEPIGPGAQETKKKVSSGTCGRFTGYPEHELNLAVSLLLRDELIARGYEVCLTREEADVNLSNSERAAIANELHADAFVRIHANGSEDPDRHGALTICPTPDNPFHPENYQPSRALSDAILHGLCASTGALREDVWETDTMSGINYSEVPVTIVEMGYMTNQEEDERLSTPEYQRLLAIGIADGIDAFFEERE